MNINVVSESTGLTKKAIKYYESEGLIYPSKNSENNYREYNEEDILKLNLIAALRILDIPISEIKNVIEDKKTILQIMEETLNRISKDIDNLEKSKTIIQCIIDKNTKDYRKVEEEVRKLKETLELSIEGKQEYISSIILRKFPGDFGRMAVYMYEPFLRVVIDSDEKKKAWLDMVEYLDGLDEPDESHPFIEKFRKMSEEKLKSERNGWAEQSKKLLSGDENAKNEVKNSMEKFIKAFQENEALIKSCKEISDQCKDFLNSIGYKGETFNKYLIILSEDYKKLTETYKAINKEIENEGNLNIGEIIKNTIR